MIENRGNRKPKPRSQQPSYVLTIPTPVKATAGSWWTRPEAQADRDVFKALAHERYLEFVKHAAGIGDQISGGVFGGER